MTTKLHLADLMPLSDAPNWKRAACAGDPDREAWFPFPSQDFDHARTVCAGCPIKVLCRDWAATTGQTGVWGGHEFDRGRKIRE
ncbi:WhiB family transcriptional regulator [Nocardia nova]|uniref:WhiB family transcriptional regulator n=1 Tax=Nocardia nova TaxID=37330 RepID=UPI0033C42CED